MSSTPSDSGVRLAAQARWLTLLLAHLAGRRVRARVELADLVQEVFLRALEAPGGLPAPSGEERELRRFLQRLARHTVIDVVRAWRAAKRDGREVPLNRSDWSRTGWSESGVVSPDAGPATRAGIVDEHRVLMTSFENLSAEHRRVIGLRQFEGLSAADTARRMGRSETAVHSLYRRALQAWSQAAR